MGKRQVEFQTRKTKLLLSETEEGMHSEISAICNGDVSASDAAENSQTRSARALSTQSSDVQGW